MSMHLFTVAAQSVAIAAMFSFNAFAQSTPTNSWRYYRPTNTGIQGDYNDAIWIGADADPWIGGYDPSFEEGGVTKFIQAENRWVNISNVDYPVIGHPDTTGTTRVSDIVADGAGRLWMSTWRGALRFDPSLGPSSLVNYASASPALAVGGCRDLDIAPDGTVWFALLGFGGNQGGLVRHTPATNAWKYWTGGATPTGGDNWPQLVWSVRFVSVQPKPAGGYTVWCDSENSTAIVSFDSATGTFTNYDFSYTLGSMLDMPGKDCVDDAGNLWMRRFAGFVGGSATFTLDYRRPDGSWVTPAQPALPAIDPPIWAFRAFGNAQALLVDGNSRVLRFDGAAWNDLGIWRDGAYTYDVNIDGTGHVWACGIGGAAKRDPATGLWQRYRVTNTSQYDFFNQGLTINPAGGIYACANAGSGVGGMVRFDGTRWIGFNNDQYGLGQPWPFPTDNSDAVGFRPSNGHVAVNPTYAGVREWNGSQFTTLEAGTTVRDFVEDSLGRQWYVGEYYSLKYHNGSSWTQVGITAWGAKIQRDPDRPGTIWAATGHEIKRTDGVYNFSRTIGDFPELSTQSDTFSGLAVGSGGIAWIGASVQIGSGGSGGALIRIDANTGAYQMLRFDQGWPLPGMSVQPLAVTPDGRVWMQYDSDFLTAQRGLCWYDGTNVGVFPAPPGGEPQWGGLPHAGIKDLDVRVIPNGYELWMSCLSRGIAVLTVQGDTTGTIFCAGDGTLATACPCGNNGSAGHGCASSQVSSGASLAATGTTHPDTLVLEASQMLPSVLNIFLQGDASIASGVTFGDGVRCAGGQLFRLGVKNAVGGAAHYPAAGDPSITARSAALGTPIAVGEMRYYQTYYRDPNLAFCPAPLGNSWNVTNGVAVTW